MPFGEKLRLEVTVQLAGLKPDDIRVEFLLERPTRDGATVNEQCAYFEPCGVPDGDAQRYSVELAPEFCGHLYYSIRAYPYHSLLTHRFELGLMIWA
jgi:starch phosphorylase